MAAEVNINILCKLSGLDKDIVFPERGTDGTAPTSAKGIETRTLATADTEEALDLGGVTTTQGIVIKAIDYDLDIDLDFVAAFDTDLTIKAGELPAIIPNPAGTVYVKNNGAGETPQYSFMLWGT
jgi:hypothetical protein